MKNKFAKYFKIAVTLAIPCAFIWFLIISPFLKFKNNEKIFIEAAKRYYELNADKLPTGKRVSTVTLKTLYNDAYIKEDLFVPYTKKPCSITESWVKVTQTSRDEYKYITYLQCGFFKSNVDHTGPVIKLKGENEITINRGEEYKELGVEKVTDNEDGKIDPKEVIIDSSKVNTNVNGTYEVTYTVLDSLKNKTTITRKVNVVQKINATVKQETENGIYLGNNVNNYLYFSGMLFRIIGLDGNNIKVIANNDIANVDYDGLDEWLEYFYDHLAPSSKKYLVKNKYCTGTLTPENVNTETNCIKQTSSRYAYIISNKELNQSRNVNGESYLFPQTISWTSNVNENGEAWATKFAFTGIAGSSQYMYFDNDYNLGVRPVLTIKGDSLVISGDGTKENPYSLNDINKAKADEYLNTRYSGEYITYSGYLWRIVDISNDGDTKVISEIPITLIGGNDTIKYETTDTSKIYNPTQKGNIGYTINQKTGDSVDEKYFVTKEISVPIYKTIAKYKKEDSTKKYKVKFSAPNMYEMFSASLKSDETNIGYWLINSSKEQYRKYLISNIGVVMFEQLSDNIESYIRPVGYLDKRVKIVSGSGTEKDPYKISK